MIDFLTMKFDLIAEKSFLNEIKLKQLRIEGLDSEFYFVVDPKCDNLAFGLCFVSLPSDSSGAPHILEHCVLCGSKKYPLKDPFSALLRSSVQTFLNAMTFHNFTLYPAASFKEQDFFNLLDVYWDSVFNPLLQEETFCTQGWHLKLNGTPVLQGVVYNEMKGYYSEPNTILFRGIFESLFAGSHWIFDSGGNPVEILDLTYDKLISFHAKFYNLNNLRFFAYGNLNQSNLEKKLIELISLTDRSGAKFTDSPDLFPNPRDLTKKYQKASHTDKEWICQNFFIVDDLNPFFFDLLSSILIAHPSSKLHKRLTDAKLAEKVLKIGSIEIGQGHLFCVGLQNVLQDVNSVRTNLQEIINQVVSEDLKKTEVDPFFKNFKTSFIEKFLNNPDRAVNTIIKMAYLSAFGINVDSFFDSLQEFLESQNSLETSNQIRCLILESRAQSCLTLEPDKSFFEIFAQKEREKKLELYQIFSQEELLRISQKAKEYQERTDVDIQLIPRLDISAFSPTAKLLSYSVEETAYHNQILVEYPTNGLCYGSVCYRLPSLDENQMSLLGFLNFAIQHIGTKRFKPEELLLEINSLFSSLSFGLSLGQDFRTEDLKAFCSIDFTCLGEDLPRALWLISHMLTEIDFFKSKKEVFALALEYKNLLLENLRSSPARFARKYACSFINPVSILEDFCSGVRHLEKIFSIKCDETLCDNLQTLLKSLVKTKPLLFVEHDKALHSDFELPSEQLSDSLLAAPTPQREELTILIPVDIQVASAAVALKLPNTIWGFAPIQKIVSESYLWNEVRVKGGAYGSSMFFGPTFDTVSLVSWDDPKPDVSLVAFKNLSYDYFQSWLKSDDIERAKLSALGELDKPITPFENLMRVKHEVLYSYDLDFRQKNRDAIFNFSQIDMKDFFNLYSQSEGCSVIIGFSDTNLLGTLKVKEVLVS